MIMFLTSCLQINEVAHFLYYGKYSGVFLFTWVTEKDDHTCKK